MLVKDVVDFGTRSYVKFFKIKCLGEGNVAGVPRQSVVFGYIGNGFITFAGVYKTIITRPIAILST